MTLWHEAASIWLAGGWAMIPIALVALVMFAVGFKVRAELGRKGHRGLRETTWLEWIERPELRRGPVGALIDRMLAEPDADPSSARWKDRRDAELAPIERDLRLMQVCVGAAPLFGLLGTVTGMLATFGALATGSGGEQTMGRIAQGISEALITTETGLVVALPGLFFRFRLLRQCDEYEWFLAQLETACALARRRRAEAADRQGAVRRAASAQILRMLERGLRPREATAAT